MKVWLRDKMDPYTRPNSNYLPNNPGVTAPSLTPRPLPLFDAVTAERLKDEGITAAVENNAVLVEQFRELAKRIARSRPDRTVNMDMLYIDETHMRRLKGMGNSRGGIFRGREWEFAGYTKSERIESHGNRLGRWRLR